MSRMNYNRIILPSILTEFNKRTKKLERAKNPIAKPTQITKPGAKVITLYSKTGSRRAA